ncbi:MAG: superoxide dismutase [Phycisphaerales bacterium]|nr:superoxide dismutase [Phycisphaerales bacterium]
MHSLNRRDAITSMAALGAVGIGMAATNSSAAQMFTPESLGWDPANNEYTLPTLPYAYDALAPAIDEQTMRIHHDKHHAGYIRGLNKALKQLHAIRDGSGDAGTLQHWQRQLSFHAGGHINHTMFWTGMAPTDNGGGGEPAGLLADTIKRDFGSFEKFSSQFQAASKSVEGSGWGWLIYEPMSNRLMISQMQNQQQMMFAGAVPLLGVDVWEHAYYLNYQNRRAGYLKNFMTIINWPEIQRRFAAAID